MDRRATAECDWLKEHIGEEHIFRVSANPTDPYYATTKLMWEKNNRPELYKKTYKFQTAADYPCMKLTGPEARPPPRKCSLEDLIGERFVPVPLPPLKSITSDLARSMIDTMSSCTDCMKHALTC